VKVSEIRMTVEAALDEQGFDGGLWAWRDRPNRLDILINGSVRSIALRSGMSRRRLNFELGRIAGWADWTPRNKPARPLQDHPTFSPAVQINLEELLI